MTEKLGELESKLKTLCETDSKATSGAYEDPAQSGRYMGWGELDKYYQLIGNYLCQLHEEQPLVRFYDAVRSVLDKFARINPRVLEALYLPCFNFPEDWAGAVKDEEKKEYLSYLNATFSNEIKILKSNGGEK